MEDHGCTGHVGAALQTALDSAIRSKRDLATIYTELARRIGNPYPQKHLFVLLKEDLQHKALLEEICAKHAMPTESKPSAREIEIPHQSKASISEVPIKDLLYEALIRVRFCRREYLRSAASIEGTEYKRIFLFLAECERQHFSVLRSEHQMIRSYPKYMDFSVDPWGES